MRAEEEGTHERLRAHLRELVNPTIAAHHGRTVKNTGDGFLAEFASVVDAVRCAVHVQRGMAERNHGTVFHHFGSVPGIEGPVGVPLAAFKFAHGGPINGPGRKSGSHWTRRW